MSHIQYTIRVMDHKDLNFIYVLQFELFKIEEVGWRL